MSSDDRYPQFSTVRRLDGDMQVLQVFGDVDLATSPEFAAVISGSIAAGKQLTIDLTTCRYIDSSGLTVLILARRRFGARLCVLVKSRTIVARLLQTTDFDEASVLIVATDEPLS
jgi:anti-anti-sigma factor